MGAEGVEGELLARVGMGRRDFLRRLVAGAAFAVPAIQSFDLGGLTEASAQSSCTTRSSTLVDTEPSPSTRGQPVTITATIRASSGGFLDPNASLLDSVEFFDGGTSLGIVPADQDPVSIVVSTLAPGSHDITARYSGTCEFGGTIVPSSGGATHVVNAAYPLAVNVPPVGPGAEAVAAELPPPTGDRGAAPLPAAVVAGSGLAAAAAVVYRRSRPAPEDG